MIIIVMGVSGCGKTSVGRLLAKERNLPFFDADDFHSFQNLEKMKNNQALTDEDRLPWLKHLSEKIREWEQSGGAVLACSALKESYRQLLSASESPMFWVFLYGSYNLIKKRLEQRIHHYMSSNLLQSQMDILEIPNYGLHLDVEASLASLVLQINSKLKTHG